MSNDKINNKEIVQTDSSLSPKTALSNRQILRKLIAVPVEEKFGIKGYFPNDFEDAESPDYINYINVTTFNKKQCLHMHGRSGGKWAPHALLGKLGISLEDMLSAFEWVMSGEENPSFDYDFSSKLETFSIAFPIDESLWPKD